MLAVGGAVHGSGGGVGLAVEGLAADTALAGKGGDIALVSEEDDGGAGERDRRQ